MKRPPSAERSADPSPPPAAVPPTRIAAITSKSSVVKPVVVACENCAVSKIPTIAAPMAAATNAATVTLVTPTPELVAAEPVLSGNHGYDHDRDREHPGLRRDPERAARPDEVDDAARRRVHRRRS